MVVRCVCIWLLVITCLTACSPYPPEVAWETEASIDNAALVSSDFLPAAAELVAAAESTPPEIEATAPVRQEPAASTIPEGSTMTQEYAEALEGQAYFWAPSGTKIHTTPDCSALREVIYAGTLPEAEAAKDGGFCKKCKTSDQSVEAILRCYTSEDYKKKE